MKASQFYGRTKNLYRFLEILPGAFSWGTLGASIILSFFKPTWVAIFIICFDVYWLVKVIYLAFYLIVSYGRLKANININWLAKCQKEIPHWKTIYHLIILPTYKEKIEVIKPTFEALLASHYPKKKMMVVLATEERDKERAQKNVAIIKKLYGDKFGLFLVTVHPKDIVGEVAGKGSNETWAARCAKKIIDQMQIPYENIIVSALDIDTCVHPEYFACLTYKFLTNPNPHQASYQPVPMFFNNFWESPLLMRLIGLNTTFWNMMEQVRPERLYTFSSHSMSFKTLVAIDFWETDVVSEDSRIFWQCFLHYKGNYRCIPLLMPVYMDTVSAKNYFQTIVNQYKQQRRWAWGVENVPYVLFNFLKEKQISLRKKIIHSLWLTEGFHSWATNAIIIFMLGWLPLIVGGENFTKTLLAQNLPYVTQVLMTLAMIGMVVSATLSFFLISIQPYKSKKYGKQKIFSLFFQWLFLPISTIFLGAFPALDSQTRLMFGKYIGFWVTEKIRKK